ncbi:MAG: hypothetical protein K6E83_07575, partial [Clostridium sp.]|nr:hypothetical protein [Clostridium sp.]
MTGGSFFDILTKLAREGVKKAPERSGGPNLENDTEERNAQERDSEDSEEFRRSAEPGEPKGETGGANRLRIK